VTAARQEQAAAEVVGLGISHRKTCRRNNEKYEEVSR
jgi:hypothetical protein